MTPPPHHITPHFSPPPHHPPTTTPLTPANTPTATSAALSVCNLTVSYAGKPVLRSVTLEISPGSLVGIIGPNGAGKSTFLKAILGLIPIDAGQILFHNRPINTCRSSVAYVPQTEAVDWDFPVTVFDVVLMGRYNQMQHRLWPGQNDRHAALQALEMVGMTDFQHRHIRQLSGGQQQRVFIARALCQQSNILLLDEPFTGVDAATERTIFDLINRLRTQQKTILVVNHDLSILDQFDTLLLLNQRVVAFGPTKNTATEENLHRLYSGRLSLLDRADAALRSGKPL